MATNEEVLNRVNEVRQMMKDIDYQEKKGDLDRHVPIRDGPMTIEMYYMWKAEAANELCDEGDSY